MGVQSIATTLEADKTPSLVMYVTAWYMLVKIVNGTKTCMGLFVNFLRNSLKQISQETFSVTAFSPCWRYLAAATLEGDIVVWEFHSGKPILHRKHYEMDKDEGRVICSVCFFALKKVTAGIKWQQPEQN